MHMPEVRDRGAVLISVTRVNATLEWLLLALVALVPTMVPACF